MRRLIESGVAVAIGGAIANGLAYLVPLLAARHLVPDQFSTLVTVLAIATIATVPSQGLQVATAVRAARGENIAPTAMGARAAAATVAAVLVASPLLVWALRLPWTVALLTVALTAPIVWAGGWLGFFQGTQQFSRLACGMALIGVGRSGGMAVALASGLSLTASLTAGLVATAATVALLPLLDRAHRNEDRARRSEDRRAAAAEPPRLGQGALSLAASHRNEDRGSATAQRPRLGQGALSLAASRRSEDRGTATAERPRLSQGALSLAASRRSGVWREVAVASSATLAMLTISYADLLLARNVLPVAEAAEYGALNILTKGAIWAPQLITVLALPRLAKHGRRVLPYSVAAITFIGVLLVGATAIAGEFAMRLAGGPAYAHLADKAPAFAATGALFALLFLLVNVQLAQGAKAPSAPVWLATVGFGLTVLLWPQPDINVIITAALVTATITVMILGGLIARRRWAVSGVSEPTIHMASSPHG